MTRIKIAKILSLVASAMAFFGYGMAIITNSTGSMTVGILGMLLGFVAYCFCGMFTALCTPFSAAKWGLLIGFFPGNLVAAGIFFCLGACTVIALPAIPVFKAAQRKGY